LNLIISEGGGLPMKAIVTCAVLALTLGGCDKATDLAACLRETEPTIQLRRLALSGQPKEMFEYCSKIQNQNSCKSFFLHADTLVNGCMRERHWEHIYGGDCGIGGYTNAMCYEHQIEADLRKVFGRPKSQP
jgi:hypothetical protein